MTSWIQELDYLFDCSPEYVLVSPLLPTKYGDCPSPFHQHNMGQASLNTKDLFLTHHDCQSCGIFPMSLLEGFTQLERLALDDNLLCLDEIIHLPSLKEISCRNPKEVLKHNPQLTYIHGADYYPKLPSRFYSGVVCYLSGEWFPADNLVVDYTSQREEAERYFTFHKPVPLLCSSSSSFKKFFHLGVPLTVYRKDEAMKVKEKYWRL